MVSYEEAYLDRIAGLDWNDSLGLVVPFNQRFLEGDGITKMVRLNRASLLELILIEHWSNDVKIFSVEEVNRKHKEFTRKNPPVTSAFEYFSVKEPKRGYKLFTKVIDKILEAFREIDCDRDLLLSKLETCKSTEERERVQVDYKPLALCFDNDLIGRSNYGIVVPLDPSQNWLIEQISTLYGWSYGEVRYLDFIGLKMYETPEGIEPPNFRLPSYSSTHRSTDGLEAFTSRIDSIFSRIGLGIEQIQKEFFDDKKTRTPQTFSIVYEFNGRIRLVAVSVFEERVYITGYVPESVYQKLSKGIVKRERSGDNVF